MVLSKSVERVSTLLSGSFASTVDDSDCGSLQEMTMNKTAADEKNSVIFINLRIIEKFLPNYLFDALQAQLDLTKLLFTKKKISVRSF